MPPVPVAEELLSESALLARLFPNGGEMGAHIRQLDWSTTPLGPVHGWPQSLRTAVSIMLGSQFPMMVHWGPKLVHFYNDGYAAILQAKHPGALGQPAEPWWREMWPFLLNIFEPVLAGQTTYFENELVLPNRQGSVEEAYFTFSHSPIYNEAGVVEGIFVTALETTNTVLHHRRLALLSHLTAQTALSTLPAEAAQHIIAALATDAADIPFALLYACAEGVSHLQLRAWFGVPPGEPAAPTTISVSEPNERAWPLAAALEQSEPTLVSSLTERFGSWPTGTWPEVPTQALLLPLAVGNQPPNTVLIVGLSARRPLDEAYREFFTLVADYAGRALTRATALYDAQRLNQRLRDMNASMDSFVHIVAHDLKGPVTNLEGLLKAYHEEAPGSTRDHVIELLEQEVHRLTSTVQGLLQVLHTQYGTALVTDTIAWSDVYSSVRVDVADILDQQQGILTADFQGAPTIRYPRVYLVSILKNLVHNALKYRALERPPLVHIQSQRQGQEIHLTVSDNGRGIDLIKDGERLFQPFTRLTAEGEGAGLGLHMIRTLVQKRGGDLQVSSTLGLGTTFTVILLEDPPVPSV
ncbi:GAF domain-containing sensor histidine kinase [Hymenobacter wooponensis]|uniref:histidine kinase n=1 Tax=Hymenobacter wooponensis TaxID=1525360 RepID=A0A4Z0MRP6_9BACT|nr:HAMP domain-containing sensor histidine kinase [Hymenobacter wooponensis]TGD82244.1 HAMP domain-containing histidine kinase [Hymenobacter wooponensis]